ncbi:MAG: nuclear transport factor 2 family protein [Kordiimonadaceae bacterium]|nr:nuclear transport factor 2 family protein [Kordiimonadaceae bacterium]
MKKLFLLCLLPLTSVVLGLTAASHAEMPAKADNKAHISSVLDTLHAAAASATWGVYFQQYTADAIFLGTDVGERWDMPTFKGYAAASKGWVYTLRERNISLSPDGKTAWFDEILDSVNYGTSRGTGVVIRTKANWKIAQYHLTFPIPNDLADGFTQQIQVFEAQLKPTKK